MFRHALVRWCLTLDVQWGWRRPGNTQYLSKAHLGLRVPTLEVVVTAHHPGTDVGATNHSAHIQLTTVHSYKVAVAVVAHPPMLPNGVAT